MKIEDVYPVRQAIAYIPDVEIKYDNEILPKRKKKLPLEQMEVQKESRRDRPADER